MLASFRKSTLAFLFCLVAYTNAFSQAAPADAFVGTINRKVPNVALTTVVNSTIDLTAAADCKITYQVWDPTANNGAGDFVNTGNFSTSPLPACTGATWNHDNTFAAGTTGKAVRAKLEIIRNNAVVYTNYTNSIKCP